MKFAAAYRRAFRIATIFTALVLLPTGIYFWGKKAALQKPFFGQFIFPPKKAYDFSLTDQDGKPFHLHDLRGKVVVFAFGFTHCPNICPVTLAELSSFYNELPKKDQSRVCVLFISLDPTRDTPEKLKNYVPFFNPSFTGLTGSEKEIAHAAKEYGVFYETVPQSTNDASNYYTINHSSYVYVVDSDGDFALLYEYEKLSQSKRIADDIEKLLHASGHAK